MNFLDRQFESVAILTHSAVFSVSDLWTHKKNFVAFSPQANYTD
jgi:hypothetical protein